jgi:rod shape-determining protein MreC
LKRPYYISLGVVVLLVVIVLTLPGKTTSQIKLAISSLFLPFFGLASSVEHAAERAGNQLLPRRTLLRQRDQLRQENQQLHFQLLQTEAAQQENAKYRQLLGFQKQSPWKLKAARVIGRDPANWWRTIKIDFGRPDGAQIDLPVITSEGCLVGRISEVSLAYSQVTMVGDPNCRVAALIQETREHCMVGPNSSSALDYTLANITLPRNSELKTGQKVVTSGLSEIFPKNVLIGEVLDYRNVSYGLYQEARIKLAVNINRLEEVFVKMP